MRKVGIVTTFIGLTLVTSTTFAGHQSSTTSPIKEKIMFYAVVGNPSFVGPAAPDNIERTPANLFEYAFLNASDKEAFVFESFTLAGKKGSFFTTLLVFTKDGVGVKGWNLVINKDGDGKTERKYISVANGKRVDLVLAEALYMVLARIDLAATDEKLTPESLDQKLKPYLDYLRGLL